MGKIINIKDWNADRKKLSELHVDENVLSFENKYGELVVIKPNEVKKVIKDYIIDELDLFADDEVVNLKVKVVTNVSTRLEEFEQRMQQHINEKIDALTEKIIQKILGRVVEDEVNKLLDEKLKKIKEKL
jgi:hypothetical protein